MHRILTVSFFFASSATLAQSGWATPLENSAKVSPEERQRLSEEAALNAQRAYAPTKAKVAAFLASDAQVEKACPTCDKDYSDLCPLGWTEFTDGSCAAPKAYAGTCSKRQVFVGVSVAEKMEAEIACSMCWPCARGGEGTSGSCVRDWAQPCPNGYSPKDLANHEFSETSGLTCVADLTYEGECEPEVIFQDVQRKRDFSERCQTSWPCKFVCEGDGCSEGSAAAGPIRASSLPEIAGGRRLRSTSFLASRVLPVDGYRIRNSLYLTQLLRMPAAAAVNVVEHEDAQRIYEEAKYKAMQGQASRLDRSFESKLQLLSQ